MASDIDISNLALTYLGAQPIVSFLDNNDRARAINRMYALLRDKLQRVYRWNFTVQYAQLSLIAPTAPATTVAPFEYEYAYQLPNGIMSLEVASNAPGTTPGIGMPGLDLTDYQAGRQQDYRIVANRVLYSHSPPPQNIIYRGRITDPNQFDPAFVEAFACYLGLMLCEEITGSTAKKQVIAQMYHESMSLARMSNAIELPPITIPDDTFMLSRIGF